MANISMDAEKAANWITEVRSEISAVEKTLKRVNEVCNTFPGEDDTIIRLIEKTGNQINHTWENACKDYQTAWKNVEEGIKNLIEKGNQIIDWWEEYKKRFGI